MVDWLAKMKGRMYMEVLEPEGIQSASTFSSCSSAASIRPSGSSGMQRRSQVRFMRAMFISGRNICICPSGVLYAFMPSNMVWA